jgi:hypothetical protein
MARSLVIESANKHAENVVSFSQGEEARSGFLLERQALLGISNGSGKLVGPQYPGSITRRTHRGQDGL